MKVTALQRSRPLLHSALLLLLCGCGTLLPDGARTPYDRLGGREQVLASATRQQALEYLPRNASMEWRASGGGISGSVTPIRTFRTPQGRYCREFEEIVTAGDLDDRFTDIRCRTAEGRWLRPLDR
jgi:surface antigen